jgi:predicted TIM-barrel fold metal-dependent hydrolase
MSASSRSASSTDTKPYVVITADSHAGASLQTYRDYLDAAHQGLFDEWRATYRNPQPKHIGSKKHKNWDDSERLRDMDADGVVGEVIFPNTVPPFFQTSVLICGNPSPENYRMRLEGIRAHNRWLVDWCAEHPERRAGIGLVYLNDIDDAIQDARWIAEQGLRGGILLPHVPPDCTHIKPLYEPDYGAYGVSLPIRLLETPWFSTRSYAHLLLSGVFERFPKLRTIVTESGCAWVPATLANLDRIWERVRTGSAGELEFASGVMPPEKPSFYAKRNCFYGASSPSPRELAGRHEIGIERILWGSDYPHYEGTFPHTRKAMRRSFHDVDPAETRAMLGENAARLYGFDLARLELLAAKVGPTPEELGVPLAPEELPSDSMSMAFL